MELAARNKVATLPEDLKALAQELLEKKFPSPREDLGWEINYGPRQYQYGVDIGYPNQLYARKVDLRFEGQISRAQYRVSMIWEEGGSQSVLMGKATRMAENALGEPVRIMEVQHNSF